MKRRIGIVPSSHLWEEGTGCMNDHYKLGNNYAKRLTEAGCIPVGLAPADNLLSEEILDLCDGFLVQGGAEFYPYHFQVIHHAVTTGKKYLGICLGEQLIHAYFTLRERVDGEDVVKGICDYLEKMGPDFSVLRKIPDHRSAPMTRGGEEEAKHDVTLIPGTMLHRLVGKDTVRAASYHSLQVPPEQTVLTVNAVSAKGDGVIEGVEYGKNLLGVQFHPEVDGLLPEIFAFLTEED